MDENDDATGPEFPEPDGVEETTEAPGGLPEDFDEMARAMDGLPHPEADDDDGPIAFQAPRSPMQRQMVDAAVGRMEAAHYEKETRAVLDLVEMMRGGPTNAYFEVRRTGPMSLPGSERGVVGKVRVLELRNKAIDDVVDERWGGGEYVLVAKRGNHHPVEGGVFELEIAGDPKMVSLTGQQWLHAQRPGAPAERKGSDNDALVLMLRETMQSLRDVTTARESAKDGHDQSSAMMLLKSQQELWDRQRREEEARRAEERQERQEREKRRELEERNAALERQRDHEARMAAEERKFNLMLEEQRAKREQDREEAETRRTLLLKQLDNSAGGGLGLGVLKNLREEITTLFVDQARASVLGPDQDDSWEGALKSVVREHGHEFLGKFADVIAKGKGATPNPRGLPAPTDAEYETDEDDEAEESPKSRVHAAAALANAKAHRRTVAFLRVVASELMAQGHPRLAWTAEQDEGVSLALLFYQIPSPFQKALAQGWGPFVKALPEAGKAEAATIEQLARRSPEFVAWMDAFLAAGPWTQAEDVGEAAPVEGGDEPVVEASPEAGETII